MSNEVGIQVGLFFYVRGELLIEVVGIEEAEAYGECRTFSGSHDKIWRSKYLKKYMKSFDFYPRGRVVYNTAKQQFLLYADKCISEEGINKIIEAFRLDPKSTVVDRTDSHYQCSKCNNDYCDIDEMFD